MNKKGTNFGTIIIVAGLIFLVYFYGFRDSQLTPTEKLRKDALKYCAGHEVSECLLDGLRTIYVAVGDENTKYMTLEDEFMCPSLDLRCFMIENRIDKCVGVC